MDPVPRGGAGTAPAGDEMRGVASGGGLTTVGHGTLSGDAFTRLLAGAGVELLVDVRSTPGSRRNPQFGRAVLEQALPAAGIAYRWEPDLGGRRRPVPGSPNTALRDDGFRGYADHMETPAFAAALDRVLRDAGHRLTAVMCAESVWWRCHRRLVADAVVLLHRRPVVHLFHDGRVVAHVPAPEARVVDGRLRYDVDVPAEG